MPFFMEDARPMLACDWQEKHLRFPLWQQPKIDGVRALNLNGRLTGRSLKEHKNRYVSDYFSQSWLLKGFDGEMAAYKETAPDLCRRTTSALNTIEGEPYCLWWLFDFITLDTLDISYCERYGKLQVRLEMIKEQHPSIWSHLRVVPYKVVYTVEEIERVDSEYLDMGFEGSILRNPYGPYKHGRCTARETNLLRIKRFTEEEFVIKELVEGQTNLNTATVNELGHTERSTHQENMVPNGMVGALLGVDCKTGQDITVAAGCMTHDERVKYLAHPELIVGKVGKYKTFKHGTKDKPRFPTFQGLRAESDM